MARPHTLRVLFALVTFWPVASAAPPAAFAQSAEEVLRTTLRMQWERLEGVENYTLVQTMHGVETTLYFERIEGEGPAFRWVPPHEVEAAALEKAGLGGAPPGVPGAADAGGMAAAALGDHLPGGLPLPGIPGLPGLPGANGDGSLLERAGGAAIGAASGDLQQQMTQKGMEGLLNMAGSGSDELAVDPTLQARMLEELAHSARLDGTETVDGVECFVVRTEGIRDPELARQLTGGQLELRSFALWIDTEEYVPRRVVMEGRVAAEGESRDIRLELLSEDYRRVESMYEPFRRVILMAGMMDGLAAADPKKAEQIRKDARESMAKREQLEEMLARMPPEQRKMVEAQMGQQFQEVETFLGGGDVETVIEVTELRVNAGPPSPLGAGSVTAEGDMDVELPHTIAQVAAGVDRDGGASWAIRLGGGTEDLAFGLVQLHVPGELLAGGEAMGTAGASFRWKDGREAQVGTDEGEARIRITSRDERRIAGEFSFRGTGPSRAGDEAREVGLTIGGIFEAPVPPASPFLPGDLDSDDIIR